MLNIVCANWFQRDDGYVQILSANGKKIFLNESYSLVWQKLEFGIALDDLKSELKGVLSSDSVEAIIAEMCRKDIVSNFDDSDLFGYAFK